MRGDDIKSAEGLSASMFSFPFALSDLVINLRRQTSLTDAGSVFKVPSQVCDQLETSDYARKSQCAFLACWLFTALSKAQTVNKDIDQRFAAK